MKVRGIWQGRGGIDGGSTVEGQGIEKDDDQEHGYGESSGDREPSVKSWERHLFPCFFVWYLALWFFLRSPGDVLHLLFFLSLRYSFDYYLARGSG